MEGSAAVDVLSDRALNRATLERQLLLRRAAMDPARAVEHLVGLQAQNPLDPYLALWSRIEAFDPHHLGRMLEDRSLVRILVMRGTIHLVTSDDALLLRPLMQPVLDAEMARHPDFAPHLVGVDIQPALAFARRLLADDPLSGQKLRAALADRFPAVHAGALAYACRCLLPLVQVPPRGVWGKSLAVTSTPVEAWIGRTLVSNPNIDTVVLRYFQAFGPATVADVATWSRLTGLREVVERLRPQLRTFRDERGRTLFDVVDGPRPDPDTPAPIRFLPEYDNVLLSHGDRSRFYPADAPRVSGMVGFHKGSVLVDGQVRALWHLDHDKRRGRVTLLVEHLPLSSKARSAVEAEARRTVAFWQPRVADRHVRLIDIE